MSPHHAKRETGMEGEERAGKRTRFKVRAQLRIAAFGIQLRFMNAIDSLNSRRVDNKQGIIVVRKQFPDRGLFQSNKLLLPQTSREPTRDEKDRHVGRTELPNYLSTQAAR